MEITASELKKLSGEEYILIDLRNSTELSYGKMPGALEISPDELIKDPPEDKSRKYVLCCRRGVVSRTVAEKLSESGYDAVSLSGGYNAWLVSEASAKRGGEIREKAEQSITKTFKRAIWSKFIKALKDYKLVNAGDKVAVCISGGKDSMLMAKLFQHLKRISDVPFEVEYIVMDPGYNTQNRKLIEENAGILGVPIRIFETDIFESVYNIEKSPCYICARMRRGYLYNYAKQTGCNKIALGHHYDDVIETILMGMLYGAQIQTMMPKLHSTNFEGMELIRPMYLIREDDIKRWRDHNDLHFLQCACKFTDTCASCENEENLSKRVEIKELIKELKKTNPEVEKHIFRSVENVCLDTVIAYKANGVKHSFLDDYEKKTGVSDENG